MIDLAGINLILFDVDGTIADRDSDQLYADARLFFHDNWERYDYALLSNQGGVGLRYWMEKDNFGEPEKYPTAEQIEARFYKLIQDISDDFTNGRCLHYLCYAYQSKSSGKWSPTPPEGINKPEWSPDFRKPAPGMLLAAMQEMNWSAQQTIMVGDSIEDEIAANAAGVRFVHVNEFFGRDL